MREREREWGEDNARKKRESNELKTNKKGKGRKELDEWSSSFYTFT